MGEKALRNKALLRFPDLTWRCRIRRILANTITDHIRHSSKGLERSLEGKLEQSSQRLEALLEASQTSPSGRVSKEEQLRRLAEALSHLSENEREILTLRYLQEEQLSWNEVAER